MYFYSPNYPALFKRSCLLLLILFFLFLLINSYFISICSANFLEFSTSVPGITLGNSGSAYIKGLKGQYLNPGVLADIKNKNELSLMYCQWIFDTSYYYTGYAHKIHDSAWSVGIMYQPVDGITEQSENSSGVYTGAGGQIDINNYYAQFCYALHVLGFSLGASYKYIVQDFDSINGQGSGFDLGLKYQFKNKPFFLIPDAVSLSWHNIASQISFINYQTSIPAYGRTGIYYSLPLNIKLTSDLIIRKDNLDYTVGTLISFLDRYELRTGYTYNYYTQNISFTEALAYGFGAEFQHFDIDYVMIIQETESIHSASLTVHF